MRVRLEYRNQCFEGSENVIYVTSIHANRVSIRQKFNNALIRSNEGFIVRIYIGWESGKFAVPLLLLFMCGGCNPVMMLTTAPLERNCLACVPKRYTHTPLCCAQTSLFLQGAQK